MWVTGFLFVLQCCVSSCPSPLPFKCTLSQQPRLKFRHKPAHTFENEHLAKWKILSCHSIGFTAFQVEFWVVLVKKQHQKYKNLKVKVSKLSNMATTGEVYTPWKLICVAKLSFYWYILVTEVQYGLWPLAPKKLRKHALKI